jgi:hypothetical protein
MFDMIFKCRDNTPPMRPLSRILLTASALTLLSIAPVAQAQNIQYQGNYGAPYYNTGSGFWYRDRDGEWRYTTYQNFARQGSNAFIPTRLDEQHRNVDLSIRESVDPVRPGDALSYYITVTNNYSSDANIDLVGYLDPMTDFRDGSDNVRRNGDRVVWNNMTIYGHNSRTVVVTVKVDSPARTGDQLRFQVQAGQYSTVALTKVNDDYRNFGDRATTTSQRYPDRDLTISLDKSANSGDISYRLAVANNTDRTMYDIDVSQIFHTSVANISIISTDGGRDSGDRIMWDLGNLAPHEYQVMEYRVRILNGASVTSTVSAVSRDPALRATTADTIGYARESSQTYSYNYGAVRMPRTGVMGDLFASLDNGWQTSSRETSDRSAIPALVMGIIALGSLFAMRRVVEY